MDDEQDYFDKPEYEVSVTNTFHADSAEDAVRQMIEWIIENAPHTGYQVQGGGHGPIFIDGDEV